MTSPGITYVAMLKVNGNITMARNNKLSVGEKEWYGSVMWHPHEAISIWVGYYPLVLSTSPGKVKRFCNRYL